jgi:hypothetical protein
MLSKILRAHRHLAYHCYLWQKFLGGTALQFAAVTQVAATFFLNLLLLAFVIHFLFEVWIPPMGSGAWGAVGYMFVLVGVEYWCLMAAGRFTKIKKEFEGQPESTSRRGRRIAAIYSFGSLLLCVVIPVIIRIATWPN